MLKDYLFGSQIPGAGNRFWNWAEKVSAYADAGAGGGSATCLFGTTVVNSTPSVEFFLPVGACPAEYPLPAVLGLPAFYMVAPKGGKIKNLTIYQVPFNSEERVCTPAGSIDVGVLVNNAATPLVVVGHPATTLSAVFTTPSANVGVGDKLAVYYVPTDYDCIRYLAVSFLLE